MPHTSRDGVTLYWEARGAGEPLLLIMGLGATVEAWSRLAPPLADRYRIILFDNRGAGRSDAPPGPYPIAAMAADAAAVLDAAGVDAAHVFGMSMGGMIAQEFALEYPARVRSLILGCTTCGGRESVPARPEVLAALGARATMTREEAMWAIAPYVYDAATPRSRIEEDFAHRLTAPVSAEGYFAQLGGIRGWTGTHGRLGQIVVPTLVVHGENDELVPSANARILAQATPKAVLVIIPGAGHIFTTDRFDAARDAVLSFLKEHVHEQTIS